MTRKGHVLSRREREKTVFTQSDLLPHTFTKADGLVGRSADEEWFDRG